MPPASEDKRAANVAKNIAAAAGCIAVAVVAFNPLDCWRVRWQVQSQHATMAGHVRSILSSEGLVRGQKVLDTEAPIKVPVGEGCLGRIINVIGEAIDERCAMRLRSLAPRVATPKLLPAAAS